MTQTEFDKRLADIKKSEKTFDVKITTHIYDKDQLDCSWYGGTVATIKRNDGWEIIISAIGDIRLNGRVDGEEFEFVDKNNSGKLYCELYWIDDENLRSLLDKDESESEDYLEFGNNNWFEFDFRTPNGEFIDLGGVFCDNVIDDNILDNLNEESIEYYLNELNTYLMLDNEYQERVLRAEEIYH